MDIHFQRYANKVFAKPNIRTHDVYVRVLMQLVTVFDLLREPSKRIINHLHLWHMGGKKNVVISVYDFFCS